MDINDSCSHSESNIFSNEIKNRFRKIVSSASKISNLVIANLISSEATIVNKESFLNFPKETQDKMFISAIENAFEKNICNSQTGGKSDYSVEELKEFENFKSEFFEFANYGYIDSAIILNHIQGVVFGSETQKYAIDKLMEVVAEKTSQNKDEIIFIDKYEHVSNYNHNYYMSANSKQRYDLQSNLGILEYFNELLLLVEDGKCYSHYEKLMKEEILIKYKPRHSHYDLYLSSMLTYLRGYILYNLGCNDLAEYYWLQSFYLIRWNISELYQKENLDDMKKTEKLINEIKNTINKKVNLDENVTNIDIKKIDKIKCEYDQVKRSIIPKVGTFLDVVFLSIKSCLRKKHKEEGSKREQIKIEYNRGSSESNKKVKDIFWFLISMESGNKSECAEKLLLENRSKILIDHVPSELIKKYNLEENIDYVEEFNEDLNYILDKIEKNHEPLKSLECDLISVNFFEKLKNTIINESEDRTIQPTWKYIRRFLKLITKKIESYTDNKKPIVNAVLELIDPSMIYKEVEEISGLINNKMRKANKYFSQWHAVYEVFQRYYNAIGKFYWTINDSENAIKNYEKSISYVQTQDLKVRYLQQMNLAVCYMRNDNYSMAYGFFQNVWHAWELLMEKQGFRLDSFFCENYSIIDFRREVNKYIFCPFVSELLTEIDEKGLVAVDFVVIKKRIDENINIIPVRLFNNMGSLYCDILRSNFFEKIKFEHQKFILDAVIFFYSLGLDLNDHFMIKKIANQEAASLQKFLLIDNWNTTISYLNELVLKNSDNKSLSDYINKILEGESMKKNNLGLISSEDVLSILSHQLCMNNIFLRECYSDKNESEKESIKNKIEKGLYLYHNIMQSYICYYNNKDQPIIAKSSYKLSVVACLVNLCLAYQKMIVLSSGNKLYKNLQWLCAFQVSKFFDESTNTSHPGVNYAKKLRIEYESNFQSSGKEIEKVVEEYHDAYNKNYFADCLNKIIEDGMKYNICQDNYLETFNNTAHDLRIPLIKTLLSLGLPVLAILFAQDFLEDDDADVNFKIKIKTILATAFDSIDENEAARIYRMKVANHVANDFKNNSLGKKIKNSTPNTCIDNVNYKQFESSPIKLYEYNVLHEDYCKYVKERNESPAIQINKDFLKNFRGCFSMILNGEPVWLQHKMYLLLYRISLLLKHEIGTECEDIDNPEEVLDKAALIFRSNHDQLLYIVTPHFNVNLEWQHHIEILKTKLEEDFCHLMLNKIQNAYGENHLECAFWHMLLFNVGLCRERNVLKRKKNHLEKAFLIVSMKLQINNKNYKYVLDSYLKCFSVEKNINIEKCLEETDEMSIFLKVKKKYGISLGDVSSRKCLAIKNIKNEIESITEEPYLNSQLESISYEINLLDCNKYVVIYGNSGCGKNIFMQLNMEQLSWRKSVEEKYHMIFQIDADGAYKLAEDKMAYQLILQSRKKILNSSSLPGILQEIANYSKPSLFIFYGISNPLRIRNFIPQKNACIILISKDRILPQQLPIENKSIDRCSNNITYINIEPLIIPPELSDLYEYTDKIDARSYMYCRAANIKLDSIEFKYLLHCNRSSVKVQKNFKCLLEKTLENRSAFVLYSFIRLFKNYFGYVNIKLISDVVLLLAPSNEDMNSSLEEVKKSMKQLECCGLLTLNDKSGYLHDMLYFINCNSIDDRRFVNYLKANKISQNFINQAPSHIFSSILDLVACLLFFYKNLSVAESVLLNLDKIYKASCKNFYPPVIEEDKLRFSIYLSYLNLSQGKNKKSLSLLEECLNYKCIINKYYLDVLRVNVEGYYYYYSGLNDDSSNRFLEASKNNRHLFHCYESNFYTSFLNHGIANLKFHQAKNELDYRKAIISYLDSLHFRKQYREYDIAPIYNGLGHCYLALYREKLAIEDKEEMLNMAEFYFNEASSATADLHYRSASSITLFGKAIVYKYRGEISGNLGSELYKKSRDFLKKSIKLKKIMYMNDLIHPSLSYAYAELAELTRRQSKFDLNKVHKYARKAKNILTRFMQENSIEILKLNPELKCLYKNICELLLSTNDISAAMEAFKAYGSSWTWFDWWFNFVEQCMTKDGFKPTEWLKERLKLRLNARELIEEDIYTKILSENFPRDFFKIEKISSELPEKNNFIFSKKMHWKIYINDKDNDGSCLRIPFLDFIFGIIPDTSVTTMMRRFSRISVRINDASKKYNLCLANILNNTNLKLNQDWYRRDCSIEVQHRMLEKFIQIKFIENYYVANQNLFNMDSCRNRGVVLIADGFLDTWKYLRGSPDSSCEIEKKLPEIAATLLPFKLYIFERYSAESLPNTRWNEFISKIKDKINSDDKLLFDSILNCLDKMFSKDACLVNTLSDRDSYYKNLESSYIKHLTEAATKLRYIIISKEKDSSQNWSEVLHEYQISQVVANSYACLSYINYSAVYCKYFKCFGSANGIEKPSISDETNAVIHNIGFRLRELVLFNHGSAVLSKPLSVFDFPNLFIHSKYEGGFSHLDKLYNTEKIITELFSREVALQIKSGDIMSFPNDSSIHDSIMSKLKTVDTNKNRILGSILEVALNEYYEREKYVSNYSDKICNIKKSRSLENVSFFSGKSSVNHSVNTSHSIPTRCLKHGKDCYGLDSLNYECHDDNDSVISTINYYLKNDNRNDYNISRNKVIDYLKHIHNSDATLDTYFEKMFHHYGCNDFISWEKKFKKFNELPMSLHYLYLLSKVFNLRFYFYVEVEHVLRLDPLNDKVYYETKDSHPTDVHLERSFSSGRVRLVGLKLNKKLESYEGELSTESISLSEAHEMTSPEPNTLLSNSFFNSISDSKPVPKLNPDLRTSLTASR